MKAHAEILIIILGFHCFVACANEGRTIIGQSETLNPALANDFFERFSLKNGDPVVVRGIAGRLQSKSGDACIWVRELELCLVVELHEWPLFLIGRPVEISGNVVVSTPVDPNANLRDNVGEVILINPILILGKKRIPLPDAGHLLPTR